MEETKVNKKYWLPLIFGIVLLLLVSVFFLFIINRKNYEMSRFVTDVKNISNYASVYFAKNIDPVINKSIKIEKEIEVSELIKEDITNTLLEYEGIVKIVLLNDNTYYYLNIKNDNYKYSGNLNDLKKENIKEI